MKALEKLESLLGRREKPYSRNRKTDGGGGNLVGSYPETGTFLLAANFNWTF